MIDEITSVSDGYGDGAAYQLSDKDDITTANLNRCFRYIYNVYKEKYEPLSNKILNMEDDNETSKLKFRIAPTSGALSEDDNTNMSFGFDDPESSGFAVSEERGNFAEDSGSAKSIEELAVSLEYVNYPSQIYRSIRSLGSTSAVKALDKTYVDDADEGGRYYDEPISLRKASGESDATFGVVGRLWTHSPVLNGYTLEVRNSDQTLSSGGWCADSSTVTPVTSYAASTAASEFAPTVASLYANEFPYTLFALLGDSTVTDSGTYTVPGYNSVSIDYTSVVLNNDVGLTFGCVKIDRGATDSQELDLEIDLSTSIIESRCPRELLFASFGNGFCSGVTATSYGMNITNGKCRVVSEVLAPTVLQTGAFSFKITDITKTNVGDKTYFNASTGLRKSGDAISNVSVSNNSHEIYFIVMYRMAVWDESTAYSKFDRVWFVNKVYMSVADDNMSRPDNGDGKWTETK